MSVMALAEEFTMSVMALAEEFTIRPVHEPHRGRCYEMSGKRVCYGPDGVTLGGYQGAVLVHGTIEDGCGGDPLFHAWVIEPDGSVYEPTTHHVYTERAWHAMFHPVEFVRYSPAEARGITHERSHFGPWAREAWDGDDESFEEANGEWL